MILFFMKKLQFAEFCCRQHFIVGLERNLNYVFTFIKAQMIYTIACLYPMCVSASVFVDVHVYMYECMRVSTCELTCELIECVY